MRLLSQTSLLSHTQKTTDIMLAIGKKKKMESMKIITRSEW